MVKNSFVSILLISFCFSFYLLNAQTYIHLNTERAEWANTSVYETIESPNFDSYWQQKINALPPENPSWNGGAIHIGNTNGIGAIEWNNANSNQKKPLLIVLPSAGSNANVACCPSNTNFIVASAIHQNYQTATIQSHIEAVLSIQQMIKNILASGKCDGRVFVMGKSQGGGLSLITTALSEHVLETFVSVPAMTGFTGNGGLNGAWPGYNPANSDANYLDACNHAKRITTPVTFSLGFGDEVTWYKGQNTAAKNIKTGTVYLYHNTDGHDDDDWWPEGTQWLDDVLDRNTLSVSDYNLANTVSIYPNPISNKLSITSENSIIKVELIDALGKILKTESINFKQWDVSQLQKGIYFLKVTTNTRSTIVKKIIKQ